MPAPKFLRAAPLALCLGALLAATLAGCGEEKDTHPGQPVAHRRDAFRAILRAYEPMGVMLREGKYDADKFNALLDTYNATVEGPWQYFLPDTLYPPSKAREEVWSQRAKFDAAHQTFVDASHRLGDAAQTRDVAKVTEAYKAIDSACHDCHEAFKRK